MRSRLLDGCSPVGVLVQRPAVLILAASVLAFAAAVMFPLTRPEEWVGWLPTTISASESVAVWTPSIAAASAVVATGQARAHGMTAWILSAPRSAAAQLLPSLTCASLAVLAGQLAGLGVLFAVSAHYGLGAGMSSEALLVSIPTVSAYLLVWVALGAWLGRVLPLVIAVPVTLFLPYACYAVLAFYLIDSPVAALSIGDGRVFDYVKPDDLVVVTRLLFWVALAICLWCYILQRARVAQVSLWSASILAGLAIFQGPVYVEIAGAYDAACVGEAPVTCLDGAHRTTMPRYREAVARLGDSIPASLRPAYVASSTEVAPADASDVLVVPPVAGFTEPSRVVDHKMFAARVGDALFAEPCREFGRVADSAVALVIWWRITHDVPLDGSAYAGDTDYAHLDEEYDRHRREAEGFAELSEPAREEWFARHASAVRTCQTPALPAA